MTLKLTLAHLRNALVEELPPTHEDFAHLYIAVGVELPAVARRRFDEVQAFHQSVIENRRARLQEEIAEWKLRSGVASNDRRSLTPGEARSFGFSTGTARLR